MKFVKTMGVLYAIESWLLVLLGTTHVAATFKFFAALTPQSLWFVSAGLLMILVGALNLLNRAYGRDARGLRWVCIAANIVIAAFAVTAGLMGRAGVVQWIIVLGIVLPLTLLSFAWKTIEARRQIAAPA
jgi:hypothetical protein